MYGRFLVGLITFVIVFVFYSFFEVSSVSAQCQCASWDPPNTWTDNNGNTQTYTKCAAESCGTYCPAGSYACNRSGACCPYGSGGGM